MERSTLTQLGNVGGSDFKTSLELVAEESIAIAYKQGKKHKSKKWCVKPIAGLTKRGKI